MCADQLRLAPSAKLTRADQCQASTTIKRFGPCPSPLVRITIAPPWQRGLHGTQSSPELTKQPHDSDTCTSACRERPTLVQRSMLSTSAWAAKLFSTYGSGWCTRDISMASVWATRCKADGGSEVRYVPRAVLSTRTAQVSSAQDRSGLLSEHCTHGCGPLPSLIAPARQVLPRLPMTTHARHRTALLTTGRLTESNTVLERGSAPPPASAVDRLASSCQAVSCAAAEPDLGEDRRGQAG